MRLEGMIAAITGGGSGLGAGIGKRFALEGASVAFLDVDVDGIRKVANEAEKFSHKRCIAVGTDVVKADSVESGFETVTREFGKLDILVNCAGISHITPFLECSEELWDLTINVNLKGAFLCSKSAIARMLTNRFGVVINMSSQSGKVGTSCYQAYCASKSGVIGLTQSLAVEFAKDGIRVNSICPGVVYTPMWEKQIKSYARKRNLKDEEVMPYLASKIPLGRIGQVEDVAGLAVFLASSESSYITGQAINVSGGQVMF